MRIVLYIFSAAFGGLSLTAALSRIKEKEKELSHVLMSAGSILLLGAVIMNIMKLESDWAAALLGTAMICTAAVLNGLRNGHLRIQHHVVRIILSAMLVIGFCLL